MIPLAWVIPLLLLAMFAGASIVRHRRTRRFRTMERTVTNLERQADIINEQLDADPQRAAIDMGKRYAINSMQRTIDDLRDEVPR